MQVNEEDMLAGLWRKRCRSELTAAAMWLLQTGQVQGGGHVGAGVLVKPALFVSCSATLGNACLKYWGVKGSFSCLLLADG